MNSIKYSYILFFFLAFANPLFSQSFYTTFTGTEEDEGFFVYEDDSSNYFITGAYGVLSNNPKWNMLLLKYNRFGSLQWNRNYDADTLITGGRCLRPTLDGGFLMYGEIHNYSTGNTKPFLLKTSSNGDSLNSIIPAGSNYERHGFSLLALRDSTFILGSSESYGNNNLYQVQKVDKNLQPIWNNPSIAFSHLNGSPGFGQSLIESFDNCYVITGMENDTSVGYSSVGLTKIDSSGNLLWHKIYDLQSDSRGLCVTQCADSGYLVGGYYSSVSNGYMLLMKFDSNGDSAWTKTYGNAGNSFVYSVEQTSDGNFVAIGSSNCYGNNYDVIILKTDQQGNTIWQKQLGIGGDEIIRHGILCRDGGFAITGITNSFSPGNFDVFLMKTDSLGNIVTSVMENDIESNLIYPNPFSNKLHFKNSKPFSQLTIYDLMGKVIYEFSGSTNDLTLNTNKWSSGVYICRILFSDNTFETIKVVKGGEN